MTKPRKTASATRPRPMRSKWRCSMRSPGEDVRRLAGERRAPLGLRLAAGLRREEEVLVAAMGSPAPFDAARLDPAQRIVTRLPAVSGFTRDPRVLVVEDDEDIALAVQRSLRMEGYDVRIAGDGEAALDAAGAYLPDLVVLDLGLPKLDGIEVARRLRADGDVPILMLTARDALDSRVEGLDVGADDYLVKPFELQELLARLRALLRRRPPRASRSIVVGDLSLNPDTHEVRRADRDV